MVNYILADYKRIWFRRPRLIAMAIFELCFVLTIILKWQNTFGAYNSVSLLSNSNTFYGTIFIMTMAVVDFVHSFSFDFRAKTIQVALGIGISRLKLLICKLIQTTLIFLTDILVSYVLLGILCIIVGTPLAGNQIVQVLAQGMATLLLASCSTALVMPLVFRTQNMIMSMIAFLALELGIFTNIIHFVSRSAPEFITRLQLERYTYDSLIGLMQINLSMGRVQIFPLLGTVIYFALGIYLSWLAFRKLELDF